MLSPVRKGLRIALFATALLTLSPLSAADPSPEVAKLIAQLKDPNEAVRLKAAKELGKLKGEAKPALETLAKLATNDADEDVRAVAKKAIASIKEGVGDSDKEKDKELLAPILKGLNGKKTAERIAALEELAKLGERAQSGSSAVVGAMMDSSPMVRDAADACLGKIDPTIRKHVVTLLYDKNERDYELAITALGKLGPSAKGATPALKYRYSNPLLRRPPELPCLRALVSIVPDDSFVASEVLRLVALPPVAQTNRDAYATTREARYAGLEHLNTIEATKAKKVTALITALDDAQFRVTVAERLGKIGVDAKAALPALKKLKLDGNMRVRDAVAKAIELIEKE